MLLNDIKNKLEELDPFVYYGAVDENREETLWNYTVFNRAPIRKSQNGTGYSKYYEVHIIRENFVPEDYDEVVRNKILEIPGIRDAGVDVTFNYVTKPGTNIVVEMMTLTFLKVRKS